MPSNPLQDKIIARINQDGPMALSQYMAICAQDDDFGYYRKAPAIGKDGDFVTAPEVSQIFGEILGAWLLYQCEQDQPTTTITLCEVGPGRASALLDIIRIFHMRAQLDVEIHLVETNAHLKKIQQARLADQPYRAIWHDDLTGLPDQYSLFVLNEFFDCLPIDQYRYHDNQWQQAYIGCENSGLMKIWDTPNPTSNLAQMEPDQAIHEISPLSQQWMQQICHHIAGKGGAGLIIDYGYWQADPHNLDTLQALYAHKPVTIFHRPGQSDITAHVDLRSLHKIAATTPINVQGPISQQAFLLGLGAQTRLQMLLKTSKNKPALMAGFERLIANQAMGQLFKVLALASNKAPLAGFEETR